MNPKYMRAILLFFFGMLLVHVVVFWNAREMIRDGYPDFTSFYAAGKMVHEGLGNKLYDAATQWNAQQEFAADVQIRVGPLPYFHPPFEALLFAPLAHHSYFTAYLIWNALNVVIIFAVSLLLRVHLPGLQRLPIWLQLFLPFALSPVFLTLLQGQDSLLLLLSYSLAYLALKKHADFRAGCWLGLGLFKPHLVAPFIVILLLQRSLLVRNKIKLVSGFLVVAGVLGAISAAVVGWSGFFRYPGQIWLLEQHTGLVLPGDIPNLRGLVEGFLYNWMPEYPILILLAICSAAVMFAASKLGRDTRSDLVFSYGLLATVLVSYHAFAQDLSMLVLPFFLILNGLMDQETQTRYGVMLSLALLLFGLVFPMQQIHLMNVLALLVLAWAWTIVRETFRTGQEIGA